MMAKPRGPTSATDRIDWREARYLARVVQLLVTSRTDKAEFAQELAELASAADALRTGILSSRASPADDCDSRDRAEGEAEGALLALWRTTPSAGRGGAGEVGDAEAMDMPRSARSVTGAVDEAELAQAVQEIERAAAALRSEQSDSFAAAEGAADPGRRPLRVWLQIAGLWIFIAAATCGLIAGLLIFTR
jgi:hypothetical protein